MPRWLQVVWGLFMRKQNDFICQQFHMTVSIEWHVTVTQSWHKVASGGWESQTQTEMFYVNDVIWFSNPLQSLTQTDSHDSIGLIPFPPSLYCCNSLFTPFGFMSLNLFILLKSQIFSCGMTSFQWLPVVFHVAHKHRRLASLLLENEWGQNEAHRFPADKKMAHNASEFLHLGSLNWNNTFTLLSRLTVLMFHTAWDCKMCWKRQLHIVTGRCLLKPSSFIITGNVFWFNMWKGIFFSCWELEEKMNMPCVLTVNIKLKQGDIA